MFNDYGPTLFVASVGREADREEKHPSNFPAWTRRSPDVVLLLAHRPQRWHNIKQTLVEHNVLTNTKRWTNVALMLGHRLWRWLNIKTT